MVCIQMERRHILANRTQAPLAPLYCLPNQRHELVTPPDSHPIVVNPTCLHARSREARVSVRPGVSLTNNATCSPVPSRQCVPPEEGAQSSSDAEQNPPSTFSAPFPGTSLSPPLGLGQHSSAFPTRVFALGHAASWHGLQEFLPCSLSHPLPLPG